ncbi:MAG TPA: type II secretion system protein [Candidatus Ozemobacteraceae bacterium]|nr:type II secretion system protein [Candidatus Ozemobacteraceae bacterium]
MKNYQRRTAFSIIEILVVMGLISLITTAVFRAKSTFLGSFQSEVTNRLILQSNAQRATDKLFMEIKKGTDIIRPLLGETAPFLVYKNMQKQMGFMYLDHDASNSKLFKKELFKLVSYVDDYTGGYKQKNERVIVDSVQRLSFTSISPNSVQIDMTLANDKQSFECLTHLGIMNLGDIE